MDKEIYQVNLKIHTDLLSGSLDWLLKDPDGFIRGEGKAVSGEKVDEDLTYKNPTPGNWKLEFRLHEAAGEYDADWIVQWEDGAKMSGETHVHKYIGPLRQV